MALGERTSSVLVGREQELAELERFLGAADEPTVVLTGSPGIGKSTVWDACVEAARTRAVRVLSARAAEPEVRLSFVVLADLLSEVDLASVGLSPPARRALEVAVLREDPDGPPPEPFAVATGLLTVLQQLAGSAGVIVALDDVPWIDPASADALSFAARRLRGRGVRFVLARRPGKPTELERAVEPFGVRQLALGGLSLGATRVLLSRRLGLALPRRLLVRLHEVSQGNPLFVLELGRALAERGLPEIGDDLPVPERVEDAFADRVGALSPPLRRGLLAVALNGSVGLGELARFLDQGELDDAVKGGLLSVDGDRAHAAHPLLAATVRSQADPAERSEVHLALAELESPEPVRLRHRALAAESEDSVLAEALAAEASAAAARGAAHDAVELADHALRLTPADAPERHERLLSLAEYLEVVGELSQLARLLDANLDELDADARTRAHLLLGEATASVDEHARHLDRALAESGDDQRLRALALAAKAFFAATIVVEELERAEAWAVEAVQAADGAGPHVEQRARQALAVTRIFRGHSIDDLVRPADPTAAHIYGTSLDMLAAVRLGFRGQVADARRVLEGLLELADSRGEGRSLAVVQQQLCRIEIQAGMIGPAAELLAEADGWEPILGAQGEVWRASLGAYLAGVRGSRAEAEEQAAAAAAIAAESGTPGDQLDARVVCGLVSLLNGDAAGAARHHRAVWERMERAGIDDPGAFPVAPDLVEALVALGEREEAGAVTSRLERLSREQDHPWGRASALRCRGLLQPSDDGSLAAFAQAARCYEELELHFDAARTLLALGRAERRLRRWGAARKTLERAAAALEEIGADGWGEDARAELARVGGRRARASGELTPAEQQIVELAVAGLANKEIAARLVVSVHTVERHLSHAYAKLGIRSRSQLAPRLRGSV